MVEYPKFWPGGPGIGQLTPGLSEVSGSCSLPTVDCSCVLSFAFSLCGVRNAATFLIASGLNRLLRRFDYSVLKSFVGDMINLPGSVINRFPFLA